MRGGTTIGSRRRRRSPPTRPVRDRALRIPRVGPPAATCSSTLIGFGFALAVRSRSGALASSVAGLASSEAGLAPAPRRSSGSAAARGRRGPIRRGLGRGIGHRVVALGLRSLADDGLLIGAGVGDGRGARGFGSAAAAPTPAPTTARRGRRAVVGRDLLRSRRRSNHVGARGSRTGRRRASTQLRRRRPARTGRPSRSLRVGGRRSGSSRSRPGSFVRRRFPASGRARRV